VENEERKSNNEISLGGLTITAIHLKYPENLFEKAKRTAFHHFEGKIFKNLIEPEHHVESS